MPDREKSILPPAPGTTADEAGAQSTIGSALELLKLVKLFLEGAHYRLADPPDAEAMGEGLIPESLTFSLRGALECAMSDHLRPLMRVLRRAVKETPQSLRAEFARRHRKGKSTGEGKAN